MSKVFRIFLGIIGLASLVLLSSAPASAQVPAQAITVSPASTRLSIDAGGTYNGTFEVINGGQDDYSVKLTTSPYYVSGLQYDPLFTQLPGTVNASQWITLGETAASLESQKILKVDYTLTVPEGTAPGGYYAVIFAQTSREVTGGGVIPSNRVGNVLYITVKGDVKTSGDVKGNELPGFTFSPSTELNLEVSNDGGVHFETTAIFRVTDIRGKEVYKGTFERMVLPSTARAISTTWTSSLPMGVYTIERSATVGDKTIELPAHKITVISPWFLLCILVFIGAVVGILFIRIRSRKKSAIAKNKKDK